MENFLFFKVYFIVLLLSIKSIHGVAGRIVPQVFLTDHSSKLNTVACLFLSKTENELQTAKLDEASMPEQSAALASVPRPRGATARYLSQWSPSCHTWKLGIFHRLWFGALLIPSCQLRYRSGGYSHRESCFHSSQIKAVQD